MTRFEYDPVFHCLVKQQDGVEKARLCLEEQEFGDLYFFLSNYLKDKKFIIEVNTAE